MLRKRKKKMNIECALKADGKEWLDDKKYFRAIFLQKSGEKRLFSGNVVTKEPDTQKDKNLRNSKKKERNSS